MDHFYNCLQLASSYGKGSEKGEYLECTCLSLHVYVETASCMVENMIYHLCNGENS